VVFGISHFADADVVVAVLEARACAWSDDLEDRVRRRVRETAGLELDRVVVTPPGTIPRTTSGKVRRAETRVRFQDGTLLR
jgi:fatty-acyl-CoA synthase